MNKYESLYNYLKNSKDEYLILTYDEIEKIIGNKLPKSAYTYNAWWGNNSNTHTQAEAWLDAGYKVVDVEFGRRVTFSRKG